MKIRAEIWEEDGVWCASVPAFPGCHSWGETYEEAVSMIQEAAIGWIEVANQRTNTQKQVSEVKSLEIAL